MKSVAIPLFFFLALAAVPVQAGSILQAGYWDTRLTSRESAGTLTILAILSNQPTYLELYSEGMPTGVFLYDDGLHGDFSAGDTVWGFTTSIDLTRVPRLTRILDIGEGGVGLWPFLTVEDLPTPTPNPSPTPIPPTFTSTWTPTSVPPTDTPTETPVPPTHTPSNTPTPVPTQLWQFISGDPSERHGHSMIYDSTRQNVILFGGRDGDWDDETWEYDPATSTWTPITTTGKPSGREGHSMVYDSARQKVLLFGGIYGGLLGNNETWEYDPATSAWTQITTAGKPSARDGHAMVYDAARQRVILFGGSAGDDETWEYDSASSTWTSITTAGKPSARDGHAMVYDTTRQNVILFGGRGGIWNDETWEYDPASSTWTSITTTGKPSARYHHAMVYDAARQRVILFGGYDGSSPDAYDDETWEYDPATSTWTQIAPTGKPSARGRHAMVYDATRQKVILFGGDGGYGEDDETWEYDPAASTWTSITTTGKPSARRDHAMVYDTTRQRVILFGGDDGGWPYDDDETWEYDPATSTWTQIATTGKPSARSGHAMVYDLARQRVILFGRGNAETWEYDPAASTWTQITTTGRPSARARHSMVYDTTRQKVILFGGSYELLSYDDTWEYDSAASTWTPITPTDGPSGRGSHSMVYDAARQNVILFGGNKRNDTWVYWP